MSDETNAVPQIPPQHFIPANYAAAKVSSIYFEVDGGTIVMRILDFRERARPTPAPNILDVHEVGRFALSEVAFSLLMQNAVAAIAEFERKMGRKPQTPDDVARNVARAGTSRLLDELLKTPTQPEGDAPA